MNDRLIVIVYISFGFFLNSSLHTWYITSTNRDVRFALPYSDFGAGLSPVYGYLGSVVIAIIAFWMSWVFFAGLPAFETLELDNLLPVVSTGVAILLILLFASQLIAGASWSKFALDGLVLLTSILLLMSYVRNYSFLEIVGTYITILALLITLGALWLTQYVNQFKFPNFPSAAYFGLASLYILLMSLYLILRQLAASL